MGVKKTREKPPTRNSRRLEKETTQYLGVFFGFLIWVEYFFTSVTMLALPSEAYFYAFKSTLQNAAKLTTK